MNQSGRGHVTRWGSGKGSRAPGKSRFKMEKPARKRGQRDSKVTIMTKLGPKFVTLLKSLYFC